MVDRERIELSTSRLSGVRSNLLSYPSINGGPSRICEHPALDLTELMVQCAAQPALEGGLPLEFPLLYLYPGADLRWVDPCRGPTRLWRKMWDSNPRSLRSLVFKTSAINRTRPTFHMAGTLGLEPRTHRLTADCSTN